MSVKLARLEIDRGESISLDIETDPYRKLYVTVHHSGRCFVIMPTALENNLFELTIKGLVPVSEEEYLGDGNH